MTPEGSLAPATRPPRDVDLASSERTHRRALDEIDAAARSRDFAALGRSLALLRSSVLPIEQPSCIGETVARLRDSIYKLHNGFLFHGHHGGTTTAQLEGLIRTLGEVDMSPWHIPLMPSLVLLTQIQAILALHLVHRDPSPIPAEILASVDQAIARYRRLNPVADAYTHAAAGILAYAKGQDYIAIDHFRRGSDSLLRATELRAQDHLLWSHRGICNTLAEHEIFDYLQREPCALRPTGFLLAEPAPFVTTSCCDEKYFNAFADSVALSFLQHNDIGSMHLHVVLDTREGLHGLLHWRLRLPPEQIRRIGVSWSTVPALLAELSCEDQTDRLRSFFTMTRFLLASWLMDVYAAPLFIHDVDMTITGTWTEHLAWITTENISVAHHVNYDLARCVPWFDTMAGIVLIGNTEAGRFYARALSQVGWHHFVAPRKVRYNIDQNILSSLTRFCRRHVAAFRSRGFVKYPPLLTADNDPALRTIRESLN
jgi:hypothetical protein